MRTMDMQVVVGGRTEMRPATLDDGMLTIRDGKRSATLPFHTGKGDFWLVGNEVQFISRPDGKVIGSAPLA